jgi:nucleoside-diphosphate-sugar epimerase
MARYFVTGATGFIGKELTRQLAEAGHEVAALVRPPAAAQDLVALGVAARLTGIPAPRLHPGPTLLKGVAAVMGLVERFVPLPTTLTAEYLRVAAGVTYLGTSAKAQRELGFGARPLEEGLSQTLEHELGRLGGRGMLTPSA